MAKAGNFQEFLKLSLTYDLVMTFLLIARKYIKSKNSHFGKALAVAINWCNQNEIVVPFELLDEFMEFFSEFKINSEVHSE